MLAEGFNALLCVLFVKIIKDRSQFAVCYITVIIGNDLAKNIRIINYIFLNLLIVKQA